MTSEKKCGRCGEMKSFESFARKSKAKGGLQSYCNACNNSPARVYRRYQLRAAKAKLDFQLEMRDFEECAEDSCAYCGDKLKMASFDRTDSSRGYVPDNVVPCCPMCNIMKNKFGEHDFFGKVFKIAMVFDPPDQVQHDLVARYPAGHEHIFDIDGDYTLEVRLRYTGPEANRRK